MSIASNVPTSHTNSFSEMQYCITGDNQATPEGMFERISEVRETWDDYERTVREQMGFEGCQRLLRTLFKRNN